MTLEELQAGLKNWELLLKSHTDSLSDFEAIWKPGDKVKVWDGQAQVWFNFPYDQLREQLQSNVNSAKAELDKLTNLRSEIDRLLLASSKGV